MTESNNSSRITNLSLEISLQDTRTLSCNPSKTRTNDICFPQTHKTEPSSHIPTQNSESLSDIQTPKKVNLQEIPVKDFSSPTFDQREFEEKMEAERKALVEAFDNQMMKKMEEMDKRICKKWEEAVAKMDEKYEKKIEKYGETLKDLSQRNEQGKIQLKKEIDAKYQRECLEKVEMVMGEYEKERQEAIVGAVCEVKSELESEYQESFEKLLELKQKEVRYETDQTKKEQMKRVMEADLAVIIEKEVKEAHEIALNDLAVKNQKQINILKKDLKELQGNHGMEKVKSKLMEEMRREYVVKEDDLMKYWKEKLESSKKEASSLIEQQKTRRLSQEYLDIAVEKKGITSTTAKDFPRVKKAEELNKELEKKLAEREEKFTKTVEELKKELEELKASRVLTGRLSIRRSSLERESARESVRESVRGSSLKNTSRSSEKGKRSCESSFSDLSTTKTSTMESAKKPPMSARNRRENSPSENRKTSRGASRSTVDLMKSADVKKNLSKTLAKVSIGPKQTSFSHSFQSYNPERTTKAILKMLSPTEASDVQYIQVDTRLESMQGPVSETTRVNLTGMEENCETKQLDSEDNNDPELAEIMVTPQKVGHQRSNSSLLSERGRGMASAGKEVSQWEDTLKQRDMNFHSRRASFTEKKVAEMKEQETERSKNTDRVYTNRYEELLKRQTSGSKKRGGSISQRKENVTVLGEKSERKQLAVKGWYDNQENMLSERKSAKKSNLRGVFEIKDNDDEETKRMKKLKQTLEEQFKENDSLAAKCMKKEVDLCVNFPWKTSIQSIEQEKMLQGKLKTLFELWKAVEISNIAKLAFMEDLEKLIQYEEIMQKVSQQISQIAQQATETEPITKLLTWRGQLRDQIKADDFSDGVYEKICAALENNNNELREALEFYQKENGRLVQFKGVDLREIIRVDTWENEYLQNSNSRPKTDDNALKQKIY